MENCWIPDFGIAIPDLDMLILIIRIAIPDFRIAIPDLGIRVQCNTQGHSVARRKTKTSEFGQNSEVW